MDIVDLIHHILLLDCGSPVSEETRSSEMDLGSDVRFLITSKNRGSWPVACVCCLS